LLRDKGLARRSSDGRSNKERAKERFSDVNSYESCHRFTRLKSTQMNAVPARLPRTARIVQDIA
jgi:nitrate/TMAO reductase-like tetraheme cytochrome c subunit